MNGTPIPEVSAMLGHTNVNITLTVYTHFIPRMQTDSSRDLQRRFSAGKNRLATKLVTLKRPVLFRKLPAWTLQTFTKHGCARIAHPVCRFNHANGQGFFAMVSRWWLGISSLTFMS
jgi:hypothetical protein